MTVLPAASSMVAVRVQLEPEFTLGLQPLSTTLEAVPALTVKVSVPLVRAPLAAVIVTLPAALPVTESVAVPLETVTEPDSPETEPVPAVLVKETEPE